MEFPSLLARAPNIAWRQRGVTRIAPTGMDGTFQPRRRIDGGGRWACTLSGTWLRNRELIKLARAVEVLSNGGLTTFTLRTCEAGFAPYLPGAGPATVPHSDGTPFSDGTEYSQTGIFARVDESVAKRATALNIRLVLSAPFIGGEAFSIVHPTMGERRYHVGYAWPVVDNIQEISIWPPMREAVSEDTPINLYNPGNAMYLANSEEFLADINMGRFSRANAQFEESFDVPS